MRRLPSSKPQSRLWQPPWTLAGLEVNPWLDIGQGSVPHSHYRLHKLCPGKETTCLTFSPLFPILAASSPALLHICMTYARLPDFPILATSQTWNSPTPLAAETFNPKCNPRSLCWVGTIISLQAHRPSSYQDMRPIYKACRLNMPSPPSFLESPHPRTTCFWDWWLLSPALCQRMILTNISKLIILIFMGLGLEMKLRTSNWLPGKHRSVNGWQLDQCEWNWMAE